jgi:chromosome segregation ATPase
LTAQLVAAQKAMAQEKSTRSAAGWLLFEEKAARQVAEQALQASNDAKAKLAQELETTHTSLTTTRDKLTIKSTALDNAVIRRDEVKIELAKSEEKLKTAEEELKNVRQTLSKREASSLAVIASAVANVTALFKSHTPGLDMGILRKDFPIDDAEREALAHSAYDAAHDFVSLYHFSGLGETDDDKSPRAV